MVPLARYDDLSLCDIVIVTYLTSLYQLVIYTVLATLLVYTAQLTNFENQSSISKICSRVRPTFLLFGGYNQVLNFIFYNGFTLILFPIFFYFLWVYHLRVYNFDSSGANHFSPWQNAVIGVRFLIFDFISVKFFSWD